MNGAGQNLPDNSAAVCALLDLVGMPHNVAPLGWRYLLLRNLPQNFWRVQQNNIREFLCKAAVVPGKLWI